MDAGEELGERGWSVADLSKAVGVDPGVIKAVVDGRGAVTGTLAEGIGRAFGTSLGLWVNLQAQWDRQFRT